MYLLVEAVPLLDDEGAVQTPGEASHRAEHHGPHQKHQRLQDLVKK